MLAKRLKKCAQGSAFLRQITIRIHLGAIDAFEILALNE
jgi:hypothetical protein